MNEARAPLSWIDRLDDLALERPATRALTVIEDDIVHVDWRELAWRGAGVAHLLAEHGIRAGDLVCIKLPASLAFVLTALAAWRLGATILPLRWDLPNAERDRLFALRQPKLVIGCVGDVVAGLTDAAILAALPVDPDLLPSTLVASAWFTTSGGSSGAPKLIDAGADTVWHGAKASDLTFGPVHLVSTPLYHTLGLSQLFRRLIEGHRVLLLRRFEPEAFLDIVERERVNSFSIVPTMILRLLRSPTVAERDLSSITNMLVSAGVLPDWAMRAWIDLLGPARVRLSYGSSEGLATAFIRGDEWLRRPGSVGIPIGVDTQVVGEGGEPLAPGETGELYFRPRHGEARFRYLGGVERRTRPGGWISVGDIGRVDADGYLYIVDRRTDMVKTGGSNVFVNEVEAVLLAHPGVADVAVVGLPDPEWGQRVHAIVQARTDVAVAGDALRAHCKDRLAAYKAPRSFEFVDDLGRGETGKLNRTALRDARIGASG